MDKQTVIVTGASGALGQSLIPALSSQNKFSIIALDKEESSPTLSTYTSEFIKLDLSKKDSLKEAVERHDFDIIFHLAAILPPESEENPQQTHLVNADVTASLLDLAQQKARKKDHPPKFIFPSSIAVYGIPDVETKKTLKPLKEAEFNTPITIYGTSKLYCEMLGNFYSQNFLLDFRAIRFPGIISALTPPSKDKKYYLPELVHSVARGEGYESYVNPDTILPFIVLADAVKALLQITVASKEKLTRNVYNVSGFSATAKELAEAINKVFPDSAISFATDKDRQKIVDSWPKEIDDTSARTDWIWKPDYDMKRAFSEYLKSLSPAKPLRQ